MFLCWTSLPASAKLITDILGCEFFRFSLAANLAFYFHSAQVEFLIFHTFSGEGMAEVEELPSSSSLLFPGTRANKQIIKKLCCTVFFAAGLVSNLFSVYACTAHFTIKFLNMKRKKVFHFVPDSLLAFYFLRAIQSGCDDAAANAGKIADGDVGDLDGEMLVLSLSSFPYHSMGGFLDIRFPIWLFFPPDLELYFTFRILYEASEQEVRPNGYTYSRLGGGRLSSTLTVSGDEVLPSNSKRLMGKLK